MTVVDWIIVAFTLLMGAWGYAQGLIVGALSLAGFLGGAFLGSRLGPLLLSKGSHSPYAPLMALIGAFRSAARSPRASRCSVSSCAGGSPRGSGSSTGSAARS